jgi:hypothetical protein
LHHNFSQYSSDIPDNISASSQTFYDEGGWGNNQDSTTRVREESQMLVEAIRNKQHLFPAEYRARLDELVAMGIIKKNNKGE